jgi:hypothetical protein
MPPRGCGSAHTLQPETRHALLERTAQLAVPLRVRRARKLRGEGTMVETTIHAPSDSRLLGEGVRVRIRRVQQARAQVAAQVAGVREAFGRRTRSRPRPLQALYRQVRHPSQAAA